MKSTKTVADQIWNIEGFVIEFRSHDGDDVSSRQVEDYPYQRAARGEWSVSRWKQDRFFANYPDFGVAVFGPDGEEVHGKTLISTFSLLTSVSKSWEKGNSTDVGSGW